MACLASPLADVRPVFVAPGVGGWTAGSLGFACRMKSSREDWPRIPAASSRVCLSSNSSHEWGVNPISVSFSFPDLPNQQPFSDSVDLISDVLVMNAAP